MNKVEFKIMNESLRDFDDNGMPQYATEGSAAFDLRAMFKGESTKKQTVDSDGKLVIQPNESVLVPTGIAININNVEIGALVLPRSSVGAKRGLLARLWEFDCEELNDDLDVGNICGLIDSDYQGEIFVSVWNRSDDVQTIEFGERIAQLLFTPVVKPNLYEAFTLVEHVEMEHTEEFSTTTERGEGGLGSTGKK